jgi:hypothetical protein
MNLAGDARLRKFLFDKGFFGGSTLWWLDQQGIHFVVPSKTPMAVAADARAQTAAGEDLAVGRRVHTVRHGQGRTAWAERLETRVVGVTSLTTDDHYGSQEHGRQQHRRDFQPNLINAVVVRKWLGKDDGPGGKTVFLSNASVAAGLARRGRMVPLLAAGPRGPPEVAIHVARLACERPDLLGSSISQWDYVGLARQLIAEGIVEDISTATVRCILTAHQVKLWRHHVWLHPKQPGGSLLCHYCGVDRPLHLSPSGG